MTDLQQIIRDTRARLETAGIANAESEARWLALETLDRDAAEMFPGINDTAPISTGSRRRLDKRVERRCHGEPLQYILGNVDFLSLNLQVGEGVLIPRPETEYLAELALKLYPGQGRVCDVCTGAGAIALALAANLKNTKILGLDISEKALDYAKNNARKCELRNVTFACSDLFNSIQPEVTFSMITANPPYVAESEYAALPRDVRNFEPKLALTADDDGLAIIRELLRNARAHLKKSGLIISEIGESQGTRVLDMLDEFDYIEARIENDQFDRPRIAVAKRTR